MNAIKKESIRFSDRKNRKPGKLSVKEKKENIQNSLVRPLYQEALKTLFLVIILLIDTLIPLEIFRALPNPFNIVFSLVALSIFLYIEMVAYNALWGKKGRWALEKYKNLLKQSNEQKEKS